MLGQVYSPQNKLYNIIILAGGAGTRMGNASEFIPKALTKIGANRAIYYIINRYKLVAHKFIIGSGYHADLLEAYVKSITSDNLVTFSRENPTDMKNDGLSTIYCLDHADSKFGTIIMYCDLLLLGNFKTIDDSILVATNKTKGVLGTFRNSIDKDMNIIQNNPAIKINEDSNGILGHFTIDNTPLLKHIAYGKYDSISDLTIDIIAPYMNKIGGTIVTCDVALDFGTELELSMARKYWENATQC